MDIVLSKCIQIMNHVLCDANLNIEEIDEVVMVGGVTRMPIVRQTVRNYFGGKVRI